MATRLSAAVRPAVLSERDRHLVSRFSYGVNEELVTAVRAAKGGERWFRAQLTPTTVSDTAAGAIQPWWPRLAHSPAKAWSEVKAERASAWDYGLSFTQFTLAYRILTRRQVREVMHDFWSNLLYIPAYEDRSFAWRFHYDKTLRVRALTSYRELLRAAVVHPAMSGWLTNYDNTKRGVNENLGRELLELFTVGRPAGYGEEDVLNAARLLTGYRVKMFDTFAASYDPAHHWTGRVKVLGFEHANTSADGRAAVSALLDHLALHPATAQRVAHRLCVRFVSDTPSASLVSTVAKAYRSSRSDVKATLAALRTHPDFLASRRAKLRSPVEDTIATMRAVGAKPRAPKQDTSLARSAVWITENVGQHPYRWPRPDGFPEASTAWASPARMLGSWRMHYSVAGNWWGKTEQTRPSKANVLPKTFPRTVKEIVEHQSRMLLGRSTDAATLAAIAAMLDVPPTYRYAKVADVSDWHLTVIRGTILNAPQGVMR